MYGDQSREFVLISVNIGPCPKRGGGELPYKRNGDARRLALGCKLQLLVSLRVFGIESLYICPFKYRLVLCIKKFAKNALTVTTEKSPLGFSLELGPHPHWSSLEVYFEFADEHPRHFYIGVPPPPGGRAWMHIRGYKTIKSKFSHAKEFQQFLVQMPDFPLMGKLKKKIMFKSTDMHFSQSYVCYAISSGDSPGKSCSFDRNSGLEGYFRDSGFDQNTVRDSGKRELYHILTDKGTLQIPGKRDSPKFKRGMRGMRDYFLPYLGIRGSVRLSGRCESPSSALSVPC